MPRDGDLTKRAAGTPLSEAEIQQRRDAARARWATAGATLAGAAAGAALANREVRRRQREARTEMRRAKAETIGVEVARNRRVEARMEAVKAAAEKRIRSGWPVPLYRSVMQHDVNVARRDLRRLPAEFVNFDVDGRPIFAPLDQDAAAALRGRIDVASAEFSSLDGAYPPRRTERKGSEARVPKAHERTIKSKAKVDGPAVAKARSRLEQAQRILAEMDAGGSDGWDPAVQEAERAVRRAEVGLARAQTGKVAKKKVKVGEGRAEADLNRKVKRSASTARVPGKPDKKGLANIRETLKARVRDFHVERSWREFTRHREQLKQARAAARTRYAAIMTRMPNRRMRFAAMGAGALVGGAALGLGTYAIDRMRGVEKLAKAFDASKHERDAKGRFASKAPQAMVLIGPPAAGKTTWRNAYMGQAARPTTVVSMDDAIAEMAAQRGIPLRDAYRADRDAMREVERAARARWRAALERGDDVILDRTNARAKARGNWMRSIPPNYRRVAVVFDTPPEEMARRRAERPADLLPARWQTPEEIEAGMQLPQRGEFDRVRRVGFRPLAKADDMPRDPADELLDAGSEAEQGVGERLAEVFRRLRDAPASELLQPGADLLAQIERGMRRATAPIANAMAQGAKTAPVGADVMNDEPMSLVFTFDARNPRVDRYIREYREQRVRELTEEQGDAVRDTVFQAALTGASPDEIARQVRQSIGLTTSQAAQVRNYRAQLEGLDPRAMQRSLRDKRFDRTVSRAISTGTPLSPEQVDKMVDAYHRRYLAYRAMTIARTEGVGAANNGHVMAMKEWLAQNPNYTVVKTWIATKDERTRPDHKALHGQEAVGIDTPFRCENGDLIRWPGDQEAPGRQTINCRCTLSTRIVPRVRPADVG